MHARGRDPHAAWRQHNADDRALHQEPLRGAEGRRVRHLQGRQGQRLPDVHGQLRRDERYRTSSFPPGFPPSLYLLAMESSQKKRPPERALLTQSCCGSMRSSSPTSRRAAVSRYISYPRVFRWRLSVLLLHKDVMCQIFYQSGRERVETWFTTFIKNNKKSIT